MKTNFEVGQDRELSDRRNVLLREVTRHLLLDLEITLYVSKVVFIARRWPTMIRIV